MKSDIENKNIIAEAIRASLDKQGVELTWAEIHPAAEAVYSALYDVFESAWIYEDLANS